MECRKKALEEYLIPRRGPRMGVLQDDNPRLMNVVLIPSSCWRAASGLYLLRDGADLY
jgi:hypothetical protein